MEWINYIGAIATGISAGGIAHFALQRNFKKWEKVQAIPDTHWHWYSMVQSSKYGATMIIAALPKNHDIQYTSTMTWQIDKPLENDKMQVISRHANAIETWWKKQRLDIAPLSAGVRVEAVGHFIGKYPSIVLRAKNADHLHGLEWQWIEWLSQCSELPATPQDDKALELDMRETISKLRIPVFVGTLAAFVTNVVFTRDWAFLTYTPDIWRFCIGSIIAALAWSTYAILQWQTSPYLKKILAHSVITFAFPIGVLTFLTMKHYEMTNADMVCEGQYPASSIQRGKTKTATIDFTECKAFDEDDDIVRLSVNSNVHNYIQTYQKASAQVYKTKANRFLIKFLIDK